MKKFFKSMILVAVATIALAGCKSGFKSDFLDRLPGTWVLVNVYPDDAAKYVMEGDVVTFEKDGKAKIETSQTSGLENMRWSYTADMQTGESEFGVLADKKVIGGSNADSIYLFYGIVVSSSDDYMKLQYTDDKYVTYTYELKRQK